MARPWPIKISQFCHLHPSSVKPINLIPLPSARLLLADGVVANSVFNNPFIEEENKKLEKLQRHVKMTTDDANLKMKNGKKICWNHRKGRCRFGTSCTFAHSSDLTVTNDANATPNDEKVEKPKKKRPGMCDSLTPGKKIMKMYTSQKKR
jgi:CCCH-type zinc finger